MRKVRCINPPIFAPNVLREGRVYDVYEKSYPTPGHITIIIDNRKYGPWKESRFIDVSFNEYLNRLK